MQQAWCRRCGVTGFWDEDKAPPVPLRLKYNGKLADRVGIWGRERAVSNLASAKDNGALSLRISRARRTLQWQRPSWAVVFTLRLSMQIQRKRMQQSVKATKSSSFWIWGCI